MTITCWSDIHPLALFSWICITCISVHSNDLKETAMCRVSISEHKFEGEGLCEGTFPCPLHRGDKSLSKLTCFVTSSATNVSILCTGICPDRDMQFTGVCLTVKNKWRLSLAEHCPSEESKAGSKTYVYVGIGVGGIVVIFFVMLALAKLYGKLPSNNSRQTHLRQALRESIVSSLRDSRAIRMNIRTLSNDSTESPPPSYEEAIRQKDIRDTNL